MRLLRRSTLACTALVLTGCGSNSGNGPANNPVLAAPVIVMEPAPASAPIGGSATFSVGATGSALLYQWQQNGNSIPGATAATFTTPILAAGNTGESFSVVVSNSAGQVVSTSATLTLGPRSPRAGDLRFKLVDYFPTSTAPVGLISTNIVGSSGFTQTALGTPLELGRLGDCYPGISGDCAWFFDTYAAPAGVTGITFHASGGSFSNLASDLQALLLPNTIINSLVEEPSNLVYGVSYHVIEAGSNQTAGYVPAFTSVSLAGLQPASTQLGTSGKVITAVSYNPSTNLVDYVSYGWQSDPGTQYETKVIFSSVSSVETDASALSAAGYIITALGEDPTTGFIVVGTRVAGDTYPRPFSSPQVPATLNNTPATIRLDDTSGNSALSQQ